MDGKDADIDVQISDLDLEIDNGDTGGNIDNGADNTNKDNAADPDESIEALRKGIEESFDEKDSKPSGSSKEKKETTLELEDQEFFSGSQDDLDAVTSDPRAFNTMLNNIYKKAVEKGHSLAVENIMRSAPDIIKSQIVQQLTITRAVTKFYDDNKDLAPYKKTVASIANAVAAKYPDQPLPKILAVTEKLARQRLQLKKQAEERDNNSNNSSNDARFPKKPKGGRASDNSNNGLSGLEKELDEMSKAIGG